MSKMGRQTETPNYLKGERETHNAHHRPWSKKELAVAAIIFETKYPDARFINLHPNRTVRTQRLLEARAVLKFLGVK